MTKQEKEIKTIKNRSITIKLSDADCERISKKAGLGGQTVSELLENFIGDLISGTYTNGSDERDRANQWYDRCWFSWTENTLLQYLLELDYDVEEYNKHIEEFLENNKEADIKKEIEKCQKWLKNMQELKGE